MTVYHNIRSETTMIIWHWEYPYNWFLKLFSITIYSWSHVRKQVYRLNYQIEWTGTREKEIKMKELEKEVILGWDVYIEVESPSLPYSSIGLTSIHDKFYYKFI